MLNGYIVTRVKFTNGHLNEQSDEVLTFKSLQSLYNGLQNVDFSDFVIIKMTDGIPTRVAVYA